MDLKPCPFCGKRFERWQSSAFFRCSSCEYDIWPSVVNTRPIEDALQKRLDAAVDALEELRDWQNGPPLVTYEKGWSKAITMADAVLESERGLEASK